MSNFEEIAKNNGKIKDIRGFKVKCWTTIDIHSRHPTRKCYLWTCVCDKCKKEKLFRSDYIVLDSLGWCECYPKKKIEKGARFIHGFTNRKNKDKFHFYSVWRAMRDRCNNSKSKAFQNYGGRGIKVCDRWDNDFGNFKNDMYSTWKPGLSLERKNNNGDYDPDNVRWATSLEQGQNKRNNRNYEYNGQTKTLTEWARQYNILYSTLRQRMVRGWSIEDAINIPILESDTTLNNWKQGNLNHNLKTDSSPRG